MRQPVQSLLDRLNLLGQQLHERDEIVALWRELRLEFLSDPAFHDLQFIPWALQNVHAKTLELVTATIYADDIDSLRADISRRCAAVCARFNSTPGVLIFCFGVTIASSRPCLDALNSLQKSHPDVSVPQLYHRYLMTPTDGPGRKGTNKDLARVRLAIQDFNPDIWTKQHSTRARSQSVVSEPASKPEAELHFNLDAVTGAPVVASAEQDLAINLGDDFRGGNDDDSDDDDCSDNNVDINMDDDKDEQHGYEDMTSIEAQRGTGKRAESAVQKKTLFGAATAERRDCESNSPFFRCGTDDNDSYEDAAAGLGDDDDDQFYPDTEHDESSLFEQQSAVGGLHDGLTTIPEETSTQLIATDTPEQSRRNNLLPTARSFQDHWTCDSPPPLEYISTADALSPVRSLSDSIQTRRPKKRSLSVSDILANSAGPSVDLGVSAPQKKRMIFIPSPEMKRTKSTEEKSKRRTMLEFTMDGIATLMPGAWVNDQVINTLSQRLTSATVGVVDSIVFCASRNAKLQLHLRPIVTKEVVLIFLHEPGHWILFRWLRASGVLEEYDSLRPSSVKSPTSVDRVKVFLRWACAEDNMAIELRQVECPQQRNGFDCGIYALCFARRLVSDDERLDDPVDGEAERIYSAQCLFTSWNRSLKPTELRAIGLAVPYDQGMCVRQVLDFRRRQKAYHEFLQDGTAGSASTEHIRLASAADHDSMQQAALATVVYTIHRRHINSLMSALQTAALVAAATAEEEHERDVKAKLEQLLDALGKEKHEEFVPRASRTSLHGQVLCRSLAAIQENACIAQSMWESLDPSPEFNVENRALKSALRDEYAMCCGLLVTLNYAVAKFRRQTVNRKGGVA